MLHYGTVRVGSKSTRHRPEGGGLRETSSDITHSLRRDLCPKIAVNPPIPLGAMVLEQRLTLKVVFGTIFGTAARTKRKLIHFSP